MFNQYTYNPISLGRLRCPVLPRSSAQRHIANLCQPYGKSSAKTTSATSQFSVGKKFKDNIDSETSQPMGRKPSMDGPLLGYRQPRNLLWKKRPEYYWGIGMAVMTAVLWGSYSPLVKMVYQIPGHPEPVTFTAVKQTIAGLMSILVALPYATTSLQTWGSSAPRPYSNFFSWNYFQSLDIRLQIFLEIGFWSSVGTICQSSGIDLTSSLKAGFLMQATLVFTPIIARIQGDRIGKIMWFACLGSLVGTGLIVLDGAPDAAVQSGPAALVQTSQFAGDFLVMAAALFYSIVTVRISYYTHLVPAAVFGACKLTGLAAFSVAAAGFKVVSEAIDTQRPVSTIFHEFWPDVWNLQVWLLIAFLALGASVMAAIFQARAQAHVPVSVVQLIFGTIPIWSAVFAVVLLDEDGLGSLGALGAVVVVIAGMAAAVTSDDDYNTALEGEREEV